VGGFVVEARGSSPRGSRRGVRIPHEWWRPAVRELHGPRRGWGRATRSRVMC